MNDKYSTWHKVKYIIFAFMPMLLFKGIATLTSSIVSVVLTAKHYANGGTLETLNDYIIEVADADFSIKLTGLMHLATLVVAIIIFLAIMKRAKDFGSPLKAFSGLKLPGIVVLMTGSAGLVSLHNILWATLFPMLGEGYAETLEASGLISFTVVSILATLVLAPINEEVLFRGISFALLKKSGIKFWAVNVLQALFFGLAHLQYTMAMQGGIKYLNIIQGSYAFLLGLFLGYVREKTGSLWGSIIAHLVFNFIGTFGVSWLMGIGETVYLISIIAGGIVLTTAGFFLMGRKRGVTADE